MRRSQKDGRMALEIEYVTDLEIHVIDGLLEM
jgi:hypothetical protein